MFISFLKHAKKKTNFLYFLHFVSCSRAVPLTQEAISQMSGAQGLQTQSLDFSLLIYKDEMIILVINTY